MYRDRSHVDPAYRDALRSVGLDGTEGVLRRVGDLLAAWSRSTDTIRVDLASRRFAVYVKRYHYPRWSHRLRGTLRGTFFGSSRARAEYVGLLRMRRLGMGVVRPIAFGERRVGHFVRSCWLITEAVPGAISLDRFARNHIGRPPTPVTVRNVRQVLEGVGAEVRRVHDAGLLHGAMYWRNILVRRGTGGRVEFYFLDAGKARKIWLRPFRRWRQQGDIISLAAGAVNYCTRTDLLRFLRGYWGVRRLDDSHRRWLQRMGPTVMRAAAAERLRIERGGVFDQYARNLAALAADAPNDG